MAIYLNWVSDAGLVKKTLTGNREAFGVLVERHLPMAHALAWSHTGGGADADDIVQDAFLRAFVKLDALREGEKFAGWLAGIVRNLAADARLRYSRVDPTPVEQLPETAVPARQIEEDELHALLRDAVATLEEPAREVLTLHYFARKSLREVAEIQGITREAAMKRLQRAREALGKQLLDKLDGAPVSRQRMDARKKAVLALIASAPVAWKAAAATGISGATIAAVVALLALLGAGGFAGYTAIEAQRRAQESTVLAAAPEAPLESPPGDASSPTDATPQEKDATNGAPEDGMMMTGEGRIYGIVMDIGGAPVSGATVDLELVDWPDKTIPPKKTRRFHATSSETGAYDFTGIPYGEYSVKAYKTSTADVLRANVRESYKESEENLYLKPCLSLAGRVVDGSGKPVPDAVVLPHTYVPMGPIESQAVTASVRVVTDEEGRFRIGLIWIGGWRLEALAKGRATTLSSEVEAGSQNVVITMLDAASVSGHVKFANTSVPAEGVEVRLRSMENPADSFSGKTVSDGSFSISDMAPGAYSVEIDGGVGGIQGGPREVVLEVGKSQSLELVLGGGGTISGRVHDAATGEGITGFKMYLYASSGSGFGRELETDALGSYFFTGLPEGTYNFSIDADKGYFVRDDGRSIPVRLKGGQEIEVNFPVKKGVPVSGVVVDAAGAPVAKASVRLSMPLTAWGGADYSHGSSKEDGSFVVWTREAGISGTLSAEKERLGATPKKLSAIPAGGLKDVRITLDLVGDATVEAKMNVKGLEPKLAAQLIEATLYRQAGDGLSTESLRVVPSGDIRFKDVVPGSYKIMVSSRTSGVIFCESEAFSVPPGKVVSGIELKCASQGDLSIAGRVLDAAGAPIVGAKVVNVSDYRTELTPVETKQDGSFILEGLSEGNFQVAATADGYSPASEGVEAGGDPVDIVMQPARILRGRVVDADTGAPIRSFRVGYIAGNLNEEDPRRLANVMTQAASGKRFTSEEGVFELKDVLDSEGMVVVGSEGYAHESQAVPSGTVAPLEFRLRTGSDLTGTVLSPDGQPVSGVRIMFAEQARYADYSGGIATTDIDGKYSAGTVPQGIALAFLHPEYAPTLRIVEDPTRLDVTMDRGGILSGSLKSPVPPDTRASIRVEQVDNSSNFGQYRGVPVSSDGGFRVDKLAPGIVRVTLVLVSGDPSTSPTYRESAEPIEAEIASGQETVIALELPQARPTEPEPSQEVTEVEESTAEDAPADAASP